MGICGEKRVMDVYGSRRKGNVGTGKKDGG